MIRIHPAPPGTLSLGLRVVSRSGRRRQGSLARLGSRISSPAAFVEAARSDRSRNNRPSANLVRRAATSDPRLARPARLAVLLGYAAGRALSWLGPMKLR
jgi:hypothetical protein